MKKSILSIVATYFFSICLSQKISKEQYIQTYKDFAIREMKRMGIPASITLAQGLLETESGNSDLVKRSNNHFGIKCKSSWTAEGVSHDDDAPGECFRSYKDAEGSYRDHSNYLRGSDRYAFLFQLDPRDYRGWAYGLKKAGYATNPRYPEILIKNIEDNNLQQYTLSAVNDVPIFNASRYKDDPAEEKEIKKIIKNTSPGEDKILITTVAEHKITINGSMAIFAAKGRSLLAIATENNINLEKLLEFNDRQNDGLLEKDQNIFLEKKSREGASDFYMVAQNESLYDVAQKNGIRLQSLLEYNNINEDDRIYTGTRLYLRPPAKTGNASAVKLSEPVAQQEKTAELKTHEVQPKEGLYTISKKYGITVQQLKEWNNLEGDDLKIGQQLIISK
ncbi:MAG: LysM peptidoglycan-binding domain-containing protein [Chitinophagaceae bacterium]|nr:LysM peptidoglycan-binding domain-containing protein [Chitinophagaceae bacterium]